VAAAIFFVFALLTRLLPHPGWMNFTAVTAALVYFGARQPLRRMALPVAALMACDGYLTTRVYGYGFRPAEYLLTWVWYAGAILLGHALLGRRVTALRVLAAAAAGPLSFFLVSNFSVWALGSMYPHTGAGLAACYLAGLPFYRNDAAATAVLLALGFGLPAVLGRRSSAPGLRGPHTA
jgi:hypothetical protein